MGFLRAHARVTRRLDALLQAQHGLSLVQFDVLVQLDRAGGALRMSELADRLLLSRTGLVRMIDELARRGLLERRPDGQDARGTLACLTTAGRGRFLEAAAAHRENVRGDFLSPLGPEGRRALPAAWAAIEQHLDEAVPAPSPPRRSPAAAVRRRRGRAA